MSYASAYLQQVIITKQELAVRKTLLERNGDAHNIDLVEAHICAALKNAKARGAKFSGNDARISGWFSYWNRIQTREKGKFKATNKQWKEGCKYDISLSNVVYYYRRDGDKVQFSSEEIEDSVAVRL